jgi:hypothetical protein
MGLGSRWDVFAFSAAPGLPSRLSFSPPPSPLIPQSKRRRPLTDVDGEGSQGLQKKKRRLRLVFITSRLSRPFAHPSTYLVSRGFSKIAVWAKQKALGRSLLRKVAIMNRVRKHILALGEGEPETCALAQQMTKFFYHPSLPSNRPATSPVQSDGPSGEPKGRSLPLPSPSNCLNVLPPPISPPCSPPSAPTSPRRQHIPLPPSPLALTNYDIFDNEDGYFDSDSDSEADGSDDKSNLIYSDFNILDPSEPVIEDHDSISAFDSYC